MKRPDNRKENGPSSSEHWYRKIAGTVVAAGAGVLTTPSDADAQIVVYTPNISTTGTTGFSQIFFDFHTGTAQNSDFMAATVLICLARTTVPVTAAHFYALGGQNQVIGRQVGAYQYPAKMMNGAAIGEAGPWLVQIPGFFMTLAHPAGYGDWFPVPSGPAFLGLRFSDDGGLNYNYGWAEISIAADFNITMSRFAYDTVPNQQILAGQTTVPEPSSAVLLVMGAAGMAAYRSAASRRSKRPRNRPPRFDSP